MKFKSITIIGLGLMGASLAQACRRKFPQAVIRAVSRSSKALHLCRRKGWIDQGFREINAENASSELMVLCTPVDTFPRFFHLISRDAPSKTIVTDVGSVKGTVVRGVKPFSRIQFVGAHPMVGSHRRGVEAAQKDLYDQGFTFLIRTGKEDPKVYEKVKAFWKNISSSVIEISPEAHDKVVSEISHLPHAAAVCLVLAAGNRSLHFSSTGFKDTTRIAAGHPSVWSPIFMANARMLKGALKNFEKRLKVFRLALDKKDVRAMTQLLTRAMKRRSQISL